MKLIIGLGNPGKNYARNRHNTGFRFINFLAEKYAIDIKQSEGKVFTGSGSIMETEVALAKPKTYVNNSGIAVNHLMQKYGLVSSDIIVIHDDLDLSLGKIRIRASGSSGGHKGIQSITNEIGSHNYIRIRIGIGRPDQSQDKHASETDIVNFVLSDFSSEEESLINSAIVQAAEAFEYILSNGITAAMNKYNRPLKPPAQDKNAADTKIK